MLHVALWEPEIPPNTGNIARLCAATGTRLHLIGRLGFRLDDRRLKRAGLDYWPHVDWVRHPTFEEFESALFLSCPLGKERDQSPRIWCVETPAVVPYTQADFRDGDCLVFGAESKGLPPPVRAKYAAATIGIPMPTGIVRSLNLATSVGIVLYEALRQVHRW
jgi:tRNA (cytidine/uridine-2'-O-)-methyltransferase